MLNVSVGYKVYLTTYLTLSFSLFSVLGYTSSLPNVDSIPMLSGSNFSEWKEHLLLVLTLMDLDISLMTERPSSPKELKHWDRSNRVSIMIMRIRIPQEFRMLQLQKTSLPVWRISLRKMKRQREVGCKQKVPR